MNKKICWTIILLGLLIVLLIGWNLADIDMIYDKTLINPEEPTYQGEYTTTVVYSLIGRLNYTLVAEHIDYFAKKQITWFTKPVTTVFNENKMPTWQLKADKAKLTQDRMLYLYGHIQLENLSNDSQLKKIITDNAKINLITQDCFSDNEVTLHGALFNSTGMRMRGNLRNKTVELLEKVKTSYEIQESQCIPKLSPIRKLNTGQYTGAIINQ